MTDIYTFGQETYFNKNVYFFNDIQLSNTLKIVSGNLVMISPNGTQYRLLVANDGTLSTQLLS
jgi:hypothetical protein